MQLLQEAKLAELAESLTSAGRLSAPEIAGLPRILEALIQQHQHEATAAALQEWLYELQWQAQPRRQPSVETAVSTPGMWLLLADRRGVGQALATFLEERGQRCVLVEAGTTYARVTANQWQLNPTCPADYTQLLADVVDHGSIPLQGVVHLWLLDTAEPDVLSDATLTAAQRVACGSVVPLVQQLVQYAGKQTPRLWVVTRDAVPAGQTPTMRGVAQAPVWGLGKVIALETPGVWGGLVDLTSDIEAEEGAERLVAELAASDGEDLVAWRGDQRYVARLARCQPRGRVAGAGIGREYLFNYRGAGRPRLASGRVAGDAWCPVSRASRPAGGGNASGAGGGAAAGGGGDAGGGGASGCGG